MVVKIGAADRIKYNYCCSPYQEKIGGVAGILAYDFSS
jgi:hypothetical protein